MRTSAASKNRLEMFFCQSNYLGEVLRLIYCHVGHHLPIDRDASFAEPVKELAVLETILPRSSINSGDP